MRKLDKPSESPELVFRTCISRVRNAELKEKLEQCENEVIAKTNEFEQKVVTANLHTMAVSDNVAGIISSKEMMKVYTNRMVPQKSPGRELYNKLISSPLHGRCPLCAQRVVSTLDHHLPKSQFPALVVSPINLIPSCQDCNKIKSDNVPVTGDEETLHPYFDDVEVDVWLKCRIIEKSPPSLTFYADPPPDWSASLSGRVKYHFIVLKLADLYISHASEELVSIYYSLKQIHDAGGGRSEVKKHLNDVAISKSNVYKNSWQTAMYTALAENEWFCDGGFKLLG